MRRLPVFTALMLSGIVGCADSVTAPQRQPTLAVVPAPAASPVVNVPGTTRRTLTIDGETREFFVHVGRTATANEPVPVVFFLHGSGGTGLEYRNISRWREKADTMGFIAVFPSALTYCFRSDENNDGDTEDLVDLHVTTQWTQGVLGDSLHPVCAPKDYLLLTDAQRRRSLHRFQDDTVFVDAMLADVKANYLVDTKRVYLAGFSNGAEMSSRMLVERSHVFAAIAIHAGSMRVAPAPLGARRVPLLRSVGNRDDRSFSTLPNGTMPIFPGAVNFAFMQDRFLVPYLQQGLLANTPDYGLMIWNGRKVGRWVYDDGLVGNTNPFVFLLVERNTHSYPNGVNHVITMADRVWPFLAAYRLP